jgi:hypothetical protein
VSSLKQSRDFVRSIAYPGLWILKSEGGVVLTMFYVDDGMVAAWTEEEAEGLVDVIASIFETRKLGEPQDMLGIEIARDLKAGTITIRQSEKARVLAAGFGVTPLRPLNDTSGGPLNDTSGGHSMTPAAGHSMTPAAGHSMTPAAATQ